MYLLFRLILTDITRPTHLKAEYVSATSHIRFFYSETGNYLVKQCCFYGLSTESANGGAISITSLKSFLQIKSSSFIKCSAKSGGGIIFMGNEILINTSEAIECKLSEYSGIGTFLYIRSSEVNFSANDIVIACCPDAKAISGFSSISISEFYTKGYFSISDTNCSNNINNNQYGNIISISEMKSANFIFILTCDCQLNGCSSIVAVRECGQLTVDTSSFVNNTPTIADSSIVMLYSVNYSTFLQCIIASNSGYEAIKNKNRGMITICECFIDPEITISGSISLTENEWTYSQPSILQIHNSFLCTQIATPSTTKELTGGAIAIIAVSASATFLGVIGIISYKQYSKNRADASRLREYELTETITKEFG